MDNTTLIVIPARYASSRFPGKPLAMIAGRPMLQRVWQIAKAVRNAPDVLIATDSEELLSFAKSFGAEVILTSATCKTGTDRVAEAARKKAQQYDVVFSLQGDAVLTPPWVVEAVLAEMLGRAASEIATPAVKLGGAELERFLEDKSKGSTTGTTVVFDRQGHALYFSKRVIPFTQKAKPGAPIYRHIGLYAYRPPVLERICALEQGPLERAESLEQLRALEHGIDIKVVIVDYRGRTHGSVDRPEDIAIVEEIIRREGELVP